MSQEDSKHIVEQDDKILVVDEQAETHLFEFTEQENKVVPQDASETIQKWLENQTKYYLPKDVTFPVDVSTTHHLENTVGPKLSRKLGMPLKDILGQNRVTYPSIEITENWQITENGKAKLKSVSYNGQTYTPE